jgi:methyl-accepting chemotaxis protein
MDAILESSLLTALGPIGLAAMALAACYFIWQRQNDQFNEFGKRVDQVLNMLSEQIKETDKKAVEAADEVDNCRTENSAAIAALAATNAQFQIHISESRPTRDEINQSIARVVDAMKDVVAPLREDIKFLKDNLVSKRS